MYPRSDKDKNKGEPVALSGALMVPPGAKKTPATSWPRRGPAPEQMEKREVLELQERVVAAIRKELPPDWEFMCCLFNQASGQKEVCGSLHSNPQNRDFLKALGDAMKIETWRTPK